MSFSVLSVARTYRSCPSSTRSPSEKNHSVMEPSVIATPSFGMRTGTAIVGFLSGSLRELHVPTVDRVEMPYFEFLVAAEDRLLPLVVPQAFVHALQIDHVLLKDVRKESEFGCSEPVLVVAEPVHGHRGRTCPTE